MYIGFRHEYGNRNTEAINNKGFFQNFQGLGYEMTPVWYDDHPDLEALQKVLLETAENSRPDMIFFILQSNQVKAETLEKLRQDGYFLVNWFGDDHWRFDSFSKNFANYFDACMTTHKFSIDKYRQIGQTNIIRSEWASISSEADYLDPEYRYEVSFVGGANAYRKWFVKELSKRGIDVECFGDRWTNGRVSYEEMEAIFSSTKINLGISNSTQYDVRYLLSSPRNILNTIRNPKGGSHVKARNFEIPVFGGFQITEYAPCLEEYFRIGSEVICYREIEDAEMLIKYYLRHDNEREQIRISGVERARQDHTFRHRVVDFMGQLQQLKQARSDD